MKCIELSLEELENECVRWAESISKEYVPDLLIYIANAGYPIARAMKKVFMVPMIGIEASRGGNGVKSKLGKLFAHLPNWIRNILIYIELNSGVHKKQTERHIKWLDEIDESCKGYSKILIIDDSVDTGITIAQVKSEVATRYSEADIKVAGLNVWNKSKDVIVTDFYLYEDTIIKAPMSKDSKQYDLYVQMLKEREVESGK